MRNKRYRAFGPIMLSTRILNALHREKIGTIEALLKLSEAEFLRLPDISTRSRDELKHELSRVGLELNRPLPAKGDSLFKPRLIDDIARNGQYFIVLGPSGYATTPWRAHVARYDPNFRPHQPWVTHSNDSVEDDGAPVTHYIPLLL